MLIKPKIYRSWQPDKCITMKSSETDYGTKMKGGLGAASPWSPSERACPGQNHVSFTVSAEWTQAYRYSGEIGTKEELIIARCDIKFYGTIKLIYKATIWLIQIALKEILLNILNSIATLPTEGMSHFPRYLRPGMPVVTYRCRTLSLSLSKWRVREQSAEKNICALEIPGGWLKFALFSKLQWSDQVKE
jgi:hypothetical protein